MFWSLIVPSPQVRVPLNTACELGRIVLLLHGLNIENTVIAVQNMEAYGVIRKDDEAALEFSALQGSLSMMSKGSCL